MRRYSCISALVLATVFILSGCGEPWRAGIREDGSLSTEGPDGFEVGHHFQISNTDIMLVGDEDSEPRIGIWGDDIIIMLYGSSSCPPIISSATQSSDLGLSIVEDDVYFNNSACTADMVPRSFLLSPDGWEADAETLESAIKNASLWRLSQRDRNGAFRANNSKRLQPATGIMIG